MIIAQLIRSVQAIHFYWCFSTEYPLYPLWNYTELFIPTHYTAISCIKCVTLSLKSACSFKAQMKNKQNVKKNKPLAPSSECPLSFIFHKQIYKISAQIRFILMWIRPTLSLLNMQNVFLTCQQKNIARFDNTTSSL